MATTEAIQRALDAVPNRFRGPGGAAAVIKDGELVGHKAWGYADMDQRITMTSETQMPICSISKQMVCQVLVDVVREKFPSTDLHEGLKQVSSRLDEILRTEISHNKDFNITQLCNMQSGIRDYWAMTTLYGARPEDRFSMTDDAKKSLERTVSFHFQPGMEFSYCNVNFHVIGRLIELISGQNLGDLLAKRVFARADMKTAYLCADTSKHPPPCLGYEGSESHGFLPVQNNIEWAGDAGIVASLADMIAYEKYADRSWSDAQSLYRTIAEPQTYADGTPAGYGFGLGHTTIDGVKTVGHGGALRGFRLHRLHAPSERLSVVVMLNHESNAAGAAEYVLREILNLPESKSKDIEPSTDWFGTFYDPEISLAMTVSRGEKGEVFISYAGSPEKVKLVDPTHAQSRDMIASIEGNALSIQRVRDNRQVNAKGVTEKPVDVNDSTYTGVYHCAEIDSKFHCNGEGGLLFGSFDGYLGKGPEHFMRQLGEDLWFLSSPRGLDAPAPGDWTVAFHRDGNGTVNGFTIGCWLARSVKFVKSS